MLNKSQINSLNKMQKICIGTTIAIIVLLILIHNPFSGYLTEGGIVTTNKPLQACSENDKKYYRIFLISLYEDPSTSAQFIYPNGDPNQVQKIINKQVNDCHLLAPGMPISQEFLKEYENLQLDFNEWKTLDPMANWLGKLVNFISATFAVGLVGFVFCTFVFSKTQK